MIQIMSGENGYHQSAYMSSQEFINLVRWVISWPTARYIFIWPILHYAWYTYLILTTYIFYLSNL
jgi:hypothetical protein